MVLSLAMMIVAAHRAAGSQVATPPAGGPQAPAKSAPASTVPSLAPGSSSSFQRAFFAVEGYMQKGDFETAAKRAQLLPRRLFLYSWDDSHVPAALRAQFAQARDTAIQAWGDMIAPTLVPQGTPADIKFEFESELAPKTDGTVPGGSQGGDSAATTDAPAGTAVILSETVGPRLEAIIGLKRGVAKQQATLFDVQNSVQYAIGTYLGIAQTPIPGTAMGPISEPAVTVTRRTLTERRIAQSNLVAVDMLKHAIHTQTRLTPAQPDVFVDPESLQFGPVLQGARAQIPIQITNRGSGPLTFEMIPDCGCVTTGPAETLEPGESRLANIQVDTSEYSAPIQKRVLLLTNDPNHPTRLIPIEVNIEPRYRFIAPKGDTYLVDDSGIDVDLYLDLPAASGIVARDISWVGPTGKIDMQPWSGLLADPDRGGPATMRRGYHIRLHVNGDLVPGRPAGTITVSTSNEYFPELRTTLYFQKGIVAFPNNIDLGELTKAKTSATLLSRPGRPFRVLSAKATPSSLSVAFSKVDGSDDYRVLVTYNGKAQPGDYFGVIHLYTDDPRQPRIDVTVRGNVE